MLAFLPLSHSAARLYRGDMEILIILIAVTLLTLAVQRWGSDSRDWSPRADDWNFPREHHA